jgi:aminomethyltransferase
MVPFAGYEMPVQYPLGVLKEHLHTRAAAGLFDVSHMGQIVLRAKPGDVRNAASALERLVPVDVVGLVPGRLRYAFFTNAQGGILDDLMIANCRDHLLLVINAARKEADEAHLRAQLGNECDVERLDRALIALQGPKAEAALALLAPECTTMRFMDVRALTLMGAECKVARSGYTGEDGLRFQLPPTSFAVRRSCSQSMRCTDRTRRAGYASLGGWAVPLWLRHRREDDAGRSRIVLGDPESSPPRPRARGRFPGDRDHTRAA